MALIERAIKARPQAAVYHFNLGNTLQDMSQFDAAAHSYRKAIALQPNFPDASPWHFLLLGTVARLLI